MTDVTATETIQAPSELDMLKQRARLMGINFSNNIGVDALRAKVTAKQNNEPDPTNSDGEINPLAAGTDDAPKPETRAQLRQRLHDEAMVLVRCRITNLDPKKKDLPGEIFTIANDFIGTVRKYVPYGEVTENGYHLPKIIYDELRDRQFLNIKVTKRNGREHVEQIMAREFSLEVLPQLTQQELAQLAAAQAAAGSIGH
jgi:hypothetical protein